MDRKQERRQCRKLSPYFYFLFELVAYSEISYIIYAIAGKSLVVLLVTVTFFLYLLYKSLDRLFNVKSRCQNLKDIENNHQRSHLRDLK